MSDLDSVPDGGASTPGPFARLAARRWALAGPILEMAVILALLLVVFFRRLLELEDVEVGGDALTVWEFARNLVLGGDFPQKLNHHTSRFGLVLPTMLVQWLFGCQATSFYIGPLVSSVLLHLWIYLIGRKLSGPLGGIAGVLALLHFSPMVRASSQILPEAFGPTYAAFATYAALLFTDAKTLSGRWLALTATGVGVILAYGAKEVYLFYAPGIALLVWFGGSQGPLLPERWVHAELPEVGASRFRRYVHSLRASKLIVPAALTVVVLLLVLIETIFLVGVADAGSRLDVVSSSHGGGGERGPRITAFEDFFALYTRAPAEWTPALTTAALAWLGVTAFGRDRRSKLVGLTLLVFFLLQTFIVRRLDPLTPWFQPHPRYLLGMVGPIAMMFGVFVGDSLNAIGALRFASTQKTRLTSVAVALSLIVAAGSSLPQDFKTSWGKRDGWSRTKEKALDLTAAYEAGIPIISDTPLGKPAMAAASLYIHPDVLRSDKGKIIRTAEIVRSIGKNGKFVARAALLPGVPRSHLRDLVEQRGRERRCAVVLRQSVRFSTGSTRFGKKCESLEAELAREPSGGRSRKRAHRKQRAATKRQRSQQ